VYGVSCSPTKHEVSHRKENNSEKSWNKTVFWFSKAVLLDVWDQIFELVDEEADDTNQTSDANGKKAEADFANVEVIDRWIYKFEDFEKGIINSVSE
tara:strand:+ start:1132 stop:1422 length:291 start_codon:yes stop_codon:yes gene_type:complete